MPPVMVEILVLNVIVTETTLGKMRAVSKEAV
jgi:hypothetical protein